MNLRKLHRWVALVAAPFLFIISCTATILMFDTTGVLSVPTEMVKVTYKMHTWKYLGGYIGILVPVLLMILVITGVAIVIQTEMKKKQMKKKKPAMAKSESE